MSNILKDIPLWNYDTPEELFGIDEKNHPDGNPDFWQHGWGILDGNLNLCGEDEEVCFSPKRCLVLVLHSTDHPPKEKEDIEIGFYLDDEDIHYLEEEIEAHTSLNKFLNIRIQEIVEECEDEGIVDLVLCVCNPHGATITRPAIIPEGINVYFPQGIVDHWKIKEPKSRTMYELRAKDWKKL